MFGWFNKDKDKDKNKKTTSGFIEIKEDKNYRIDKSGNIKIEVITRDNYIHYSLPSFLTILKPLITSHTENNITFKSHKYYCNFEPDYYSYCSLYRDNFHKSIEYKKNFIKYKKTELETYEYSKKDKYWKLKNTEVIRTEVEYEKTPLEVFKEECESKYKLIETEEEFNEYMSSTLDCDTWCRKKLYDKMKELGLGDGFINQFADLVGNNLDKYHAMIDLSGEVTDKDTLMYLYTYKFRNK